METPAPDARRTKPRVSHLYHVLPDVVFQALKGATLGGKPLFVARETIVGGDAIYLFTEAGYLEFFTPESIGHNFPIGMSGMEWQLPVGYEMHERLTHLASAVGTTYTLEIDPDHGRTTATPKLTAWPSVYTWFMRPIPKDQCSERFRAEMEAHEKSQQTHVGKAITHAFLGVLDDEVGPLIEEAVTAGYLRTDDDQYYFRHPAGGTPELNFWADGNDFPRIFKISIMLPDELQKAELQIDELPDNYEVRVGGSYLSFNFRIPRE